MTKKKRGRRRSEKSVDDSISIVVTVNDFANAVKATSRIGKSRSHVNLREPVIAPDNEEISEEDFSNSTEMSETSPTREKKPTGDAESGDSGRVYPYDLWCVLSRYIAPESVQTFALLCKASYTVTKEASFWLDLYSRHAGLPSRQAYVSTGKELLPYQLTLNVINKYYRGNLRAAVIRALYHVYPTFQARLSNPQSRIDPHVLEGLICDQVSSSKVRTPGGGKSFERLTMNFSKAKPVHARSNAKYVEDNIQQDTSKDLPENFDDERENGNDEEERILPKLDIRLSDEESKWLLVIDSESYAMVSPTISAKKLLQLRLTATGPGYIYQKASLTFGPRHLRTDKDWTGRVVNHSCETIVADVGSVLAIKALPWYHPSYFGCISPF